MADQTQVLSFFREGLTASDLANANEGVTSSVRLAEGDAPKGSIGLIEGVAGKANIVNRNRRYYSQTVYELAVERAKPEIEAGRFLGEVDHPWWGSLRGAAFRFTKLYMDSDLMKFEGIILDTEDGRHLKALLEGGVGVAVSTRGYGSSKSEKMKVGDKEVEVAVIQNDFRLEGIDFVLFPSNPHGAVTRHEHQNPDIKENAMTLEELRQKHPDLVAQIESAAREGYVSEADRDAAVEDARNQAQESEENTARVGAIEAIVEALRPLVPALSTEEEKADALAQLRSRVESLESDLSEARERAEKAERERERARIEAERSRLVDELLEGFDHAELVRDELLALEGEDKIRSVFEARKSFIEAVMSRREVDSAGADKDSGTGKAEAKGDVDDETPEDVKKAIAEQRALADLD